jgi:NAD(P)-dependent dehydrogenase (short-subunit alcohol dehydrogenase family)
MAPRPREHLRVALDPRAKEANVLDKRIILTGATYGIGASIARALVEAGASVAGLARSTEVGEQRARELTEAGPGTMRFHRGDVSVRSEVHDAFRAAVDWMGGLDVLVHVAGVETGGPPERETDADWDHTFAVNAKGTFISNQEAFPYLKDGGGGTILNFGSGAGLAGLATNAIYSASKGAVAAWTRSVAAAWGRYGINVNNVCPATWSPMYDEHRARLTPEQLERHDAAMTEMIHMGGKLGDTDRDVAPMVVFLCSDGARYVTGQTLCIDGGAQKVR